MPAPHSHPWLLNVAPTPPESRPYLPPQCPTPGPSPALRPGRFPAISPRSGPAALPAPLGAAPVPAHPPATQSAATSAATIAASPSAEPAPPRRPMSAMSPAGQTAQRPAHRLTDSRRSQSTSGVQRWWEGLGGADQSPQQRLACHGAEQSAVPPGAESSFEWRSRLANQIARGLRTIFLPALKSLRGAARRRSQLTADSANRSARGRGFARAYQPDSGGAGRGCD